MRLYEVLKNNSGIKDSVPVKYSAGWILRLYNPLLFSFYYQLMTFREHDNNHYCMLPSQTNYCKY